MMAGYIRLPRDSQDDDLRIIGNTDNDSNHPGGPTHKRQKRRGTSIEFMLRIFGVVISITAAGVLFATLNNGRYNAGRREAIPGTMIALAALVSHLSVATRPGIRQVIRKIGLCEDCKQRVLGHMQSKPRVPLLINSIITLWSFIVGVIMTTKPYPTPQAAGSLLIVLSVLHLALCIFGIWARKTRLEVRMVSNDSSASSPATSIHSPEMCYQDVAGAPEAQPLNAEETTAEAVESKA